MSKKKNKNEFQGLVSVNLSEQEVKKKLRIKGKGYQDSIITVDCFSTKGGVYVPPVWAAENNIDFNPNFTEISVKWPRSKFSPRHNQAEVVKQVIAKLQDTGGCLLDCPTDFGKTITSLRIAKLLNARVLFTCHKSDVLTQTIKTAKKFFNIKQEDIGMIKGASDTVGLITFATMQTAAKRIADSQ